MSKEKVARRPDILPEHTNLGTNPNPETLTDPHDNIAKHVSQLQHESNLNDIFVKRFRNGLRALKEEVNAENKDFTLRHTSRLLPLVQRVAVEEGRILKVYIQEEPFLQMRQDILMESSHLSGKQTALETITEHVEGKRTRGTDKSAVA